MARSAHPQAALTSRERVDRFLRRRDHDRIPRSDNFWAETIARWQGEGLDGDARTVLEMLGNDFIGVNWADPKPFPGRHDVLREDAETITYVDEFGAVLRSWKHRSGTPEHIGFGCDSREAWEREYKPALLAAGVQANFDASRQDQLRGDREGKWRYLSGLEPFESMRRIIGDETGLIAMAGEPAWIVDFSGTLTDLVIREFDALEAAGIEFDGVWIYGDMAYNHGTLCSPAMYEDLIWPQHKRLAGWARARGKPCIFHTDGDVNGVLDLYLKAGFDALHPIEAKANMDVRRMAPAYGDRLSFFGNIDVMVMATNDRELIEAEVRSKLAACMPFNAYAYHSDHSVPPAVSWGSYRFVIDLLDEHGRYR
jgi:uroporphyrinogen decarboxylase